MSTYSATLTIRVPASLADVAAAVGRAMDPDIGGADSFRPDEADPTVLVCTTPCTPEFRAQAFAMLESPEFLHSAVVADYAARWSGIEPPTLEQCTEFVNQSTIE